MFAVYFSDINLVLSHLWNFLKLLSLNKTLNQLSVKLSFPGTVVKFSPTMTKLLVNNGSGATHLPYMYRQVMLLFRTTILQVRPVPPSRRAVRVRDEYCVCVPTSGTTWADWLTGLLVNHIDVFMCDASLLHVNMEATECPHMSAFPTCCEDVCRYMWDSWR